MIALEDRRMLALNITTATGSGASQRLACGVAGIDQRTLQRWNANEGLSKGDGRPQAVHPVPSHALSADERTKLLSVANEPRFASVPPARIVPMLADEGGCTWPANRALPEYCVSKDRPHTGVAPKRPRLCDHPPRTLQVRCVRSGVGT